MKKNITISLIVSVAISVILMVLNRIYAAITGHIFGLTIPGGDCVEKIGFGWNELTSFPEMTVEEEATWTPDIELGFDVISFVVTMLILFVVVLSICTLKSRKK